MLDLILLIFFSSRIYRMATAKLQSPWKWVLNYISTYILVMFTFTFLLVLIVGVDVVKKPEQHLPLLLFTVPLTIGFQFFLFNFFKRMLNRIGGDYFKEDEPPAPTPPSNGKPDLSYFR